MVSCTVVCSAWLPRARTLLYHTVVFERPTQVDCFMRTMTENPWFADMVHELLIYPSSSTPYVPYIHAVLSTRFPHLQIRTLEFHLYNVNRWLYPPHHHLQRAMLPITTLVLDGIPKTRWTDIFRLIWSLRGLQSLHLDGRRLGVDSAINFSDSELQRLENIRRPWTCAALTTLVISVRQSCASSIALMLRPNYRHLHARISGFSHCPGKPLARLFSGSTMPTWTPHSS